MPNTASSSRSQRLSAGWPARDSVPGMLGSLFLVAAGALLLALAGDRLVDSAVVLARKARLTPAVIGLTIVAAGTSLPELFVSATAALAGTPEIALGNVIGSNIANVGLVLGVCALVATIPVGRGILRFDYPVMLAVSLALPPICWNGILSRLEGALAVAVLIGYLAWSLALARRAAGSLPAAGALPAAALGSHSWALLLWLLAAFAGLGLGARFLVIGAVDIARALGISERVVGLTIVAVGTSLPELVASAAAALKQQHDMAVANIVGSNLFNLLGILGVTALIRPLAVDPAMLRFDIPVMIGFALLLLPMLRDLVLSRAEGGVLLACYAAYLAALARTG